MVKSPIVYTAGLLRQRGDRVETDRLGLARRDGRAAALLPAEREGLERDALAQHLHLPARWLIARQRATEPRYEPDRSPADERPPADPVKLVDRALGWWGTPRSRPQTRNALLSYAQTTMAAAIADAERQKTVSVMAYNALRHLAAVSPEMQTA